MHRVLGHDPAASRLSDVSDLILLSFRLPDHRRLLFDWRPPVQKTTTWGTDSSRQGQSSARQTKSSPNAVPRGSNVYALLVAIHDQQAAGHFPSTARLRGSQFLCLGGEFPGISEQRGQSHHLRDLQRNLPDRFQVCHPLQVQFRQGRASAKNQCEPHARSCGPRSMCGRPS